MRRFTATSTNLFLVVWLLALAAPVIAHDEKQRSGSLDRVAVAGTPALEQRLGAGVPLDLVFTDEHGATAPLARYFDGKPVLLALVYYDCQQICPLVIDSLARSLRPVTFNAAEQYRVVAVSIDPRETPNLAREKKRAATAHLPPQAAAGWHFLVGDQPAIDRLAQAVGFRYSEKKDADKDRYIHPSGIMVVTPQAKIARYFYGFDYPPRDLRLALVEASGNRIGSPVDQLLLLCYKYDPTQGKYTLAILNFLRFSGGATALGLAAYLLIMFGRERGARATRAQRREETR